MKIKFQLFRILSNLFENLLNRSNELLTMPEKNASCTTDMSLPLFFKKKNPIFFYFFKICSPRIGLKVVIPDSGQLFFKLAYPLGVSNGFTA